MIQVDGAPVLVNEYFLGHPMMVLGDFGAVDSAYNDSDVVVRSTANPAVALDQVWRRFGMNPCTMMPG